MLTVATSRTIVHSVRYKCYPLNPRAADMIIERANELLKPITSVGFFHAGKVYNTGRAVAETEFDVGLTIGFNSATEYDEYMKDPKHMDYVRFVLRGHRLKDSTLKSADERHDEFINYIMNGKERRETQVDTAVANEEIVWSGEKVDDFISSL